MDPVDRRHALLAAVGGSLVALAATEAAKAQQVPNIKDVATKTIVADVVGKPPLVSMSAERDRFVALATSVVAAGRLPADFSVSFEAGVVNDLEKIASEEKIAFTHNARLVEPLLGEISSLLDRCIAYRKDGNDLELSAVAAAATRITADVVRELDQNLLQLDAGRDAASVLAANYPDVAKAFDDAVDKGIGKASHLQMNAQALANKKIADVSEAKNKLLLTRLKYTQEIARQLMGRHDVPGNADNFLERRDLVRRLFTSDITSAYRRALAASEGLAVIFDYQKPVPKPAKTGFLDDWVIWTREAMRAIARIGENEIEFTRQIYLNLTKGVPVVSFNNDNEFAGLKSTRLRSIGISFASPNGTTQADNQGNASIGIVLIKSDPKIGPKVVIPIANVRQYTSLRDPMPVDGGLIYNVDPKGPWTARLNAKGFSGDGFIWERGENIKNVIVTMVVVGVPDPALDSSWWLDRDRV